MALTGRKQKNLVEIAVEIVLENRGPFSRDPVPLLSPKYGMFVAENEENTRGAE
jgi:hypothetical protein